MYTFQRGKRDTKALSVCIIMGFIIWSSLLLAGCKRKAAPTPSQFGYASFTIQWDSISKKDIPEDILRFCFYPVDDGPMILTETDGSNLRIALAPGKYGLLVYNYRKNNFHLFNRTTFKEIAVGFQQEKEGVAKAATIPVYGTMIQSFEVKANEDINTTITPTSFTKNVYFEIHIPPAQNARIKACEGVLDGVSPMMSISSRAMQRDSTTSLPLFFAKDKDGFDGQTLLLDGVRADETNETTHALTLHFTLHNGKSVSSTVDLGFDLFKINHQDILVHIDAALDMKEEPVISLSCDTVCTYSE